MVRKSNALLDYAVNICSLYPETTVCYSYFHVFLLYPRLHIFRHIIANHRLKTSFKLPKRFWLLYLFNKVNINYVYEECLTIRWVTFIPVWIVLMSANFVLLTSVLLHTPARFHHKLPNNFGIWLYYTKLDLLFQRLPTPYGNNKQLISNDVWLIWALIISIVGISNFAWTMNVVKRVCNYMWHPKYIYCYEAHTTCPWRFLWMSWFGTTIP